MKKKASKPKAKKPQHRSIDFVSIVIFSIAAAVAIQLGMLAYGASVAADLTNFMNVLP